MKKLCLLIVLVLLLASMTAAIAQDKPFAGQTIRVVLANHAWTDAVAPILSRFEEETGIKVEWESYGEEQLNQKLTTEFIAGKAGIDVFMTRPLQEGANMEMNGWYQDLKDYVSKDAEYDFEDFTEASRSAVTFNGTITAIPLVTEQEILYYRKDILEEKGITVPTTMEELYAAAEALNDPDNDFYGFVARGQRSPLVTQLSAYIYSYGGDWFDRDTYTATLNTPETLAGIEMYSNLLRNFGPPGVLNMHWAQCIGIFNEKKVALYTDASSLYPNLLDPTKSDVADVTGCAVFPAGPEGSVSYDITAWGLAMYGESENKDAAWEFIRWTTSRENSLYIQGEKAQQLARTSVWADPEGIKSFPADWAAAVAGTINAKSYDRPLITAVTEARDIIGGVVVTAIEGGDFEAVADEANAQFQSLLDLEK